MSYRVDITPEADKALSKLDKPIRKAAEKLFARVETLDNPRAIGKPLQGELKGYWRYEFHGDWRAICKIKDDIITVVVVRVGARDKIYD